MHRIDRALIDRILDNPDSFQAFCDIGQYIGPRDANAPDWGLSRPERNFFEFQTYDSELCRSGHTFFFLNPSGGQVSGILAALEDMGLDVEKRILLEACSVFPNSQVPTDFDTREQAIEAISCEETDAVWSRLDREYHGSWEFHCRRIGHVMDYLRKHRDQILQPETA